jgi:signal transduction histidine kinase
MRLAVPSSEARWRVPRRSALAWSGPLVLAGLLAGLALAAVPVTLELTGVSVDGVPVSAGAGEIRLNAGQVVRVSVACRPPRPGSLFRYSLNGGIDWSAPVGDSVLVLNLPGPGTHRIFLGATEASGGWQSDPLVLSAHVATTGGDAEKPALFAKGRPPWGLLVLTAVLAVAIGAAGAFLLVRRTGRGRSALARKVVPRGAKLIGDGAHARVGAPKAGVTAAGTVSGGAAVPAGGGSGAPGAGAADGSPAASGPPPAADTSVIDLTDVPREDLEDEVTRLRTRVQDLLEGTRRLRQANTDLRQEIGFLDQSNKELRELQRRKDELMASLAHDIRNPAAAVAQLCEILQGYDLGAQQQQRFISDLVLTASRILKLSQEMSNAIVAEVRTLPLDLKVDSIRPAVEAVVRMNQHTAARKNITIKAVLPGNLPQIEMDGSRIEEVIDNLVSNAVKYSRPDSSVRVEAKGTPSHLTIEVTDSGVGLSQKDLDEAFMFGKRLSTAPTGGEDSTGVGLWVVRKIVEAHRGVVWVRSTPGKGSTFSVMLPTTQR